MLFYYTSLYRTEGSTEHQAPVGRELVTCLAGFFKQPALCTFTA